jgi:hypothetical protein
VGTIADAIANMRTTVGDQFAAQAASIGRTMEAVSGLPDRTELWLTSGGIGTGSTATSRLMSHFKHTKPT